MSLTVRFLGTSASRPTVERNVTSVAIMREGETLLFDCGEGTQRQMMRYGVSFALEDIFFTHFHADHVIGVIGLMRTMSLQGRTERLRLWGPRGAIRTLKRAEEFGMDRLSFALEVAELDPDMKPSRADVSTFATARFQTIASPQQSKELTASRRSAIVISASGMATGGRVLHHMAAALPDARNTILFVGYQAAGTRGRSLVDGAREVKIHGQAVAVNARIARNDSMSAHADRNEILRWLQTVPAAPGRLCLVHGEPGPMDALKQRITDQLGWHAATPTHREVVSL